MHWKMNCGLFLVVMNHWSHQTLVFFTSAVAQSLPVSASLSGYVAGFVDPEISNRPDLFDVYVNLPDSEITISQNAKGESLVCLS